MRKLRNDDSPIDVWRTLVVALFLGLLAALVVIVKWRYAIFRNGVDLGIFTQVIAGSDGHFASTAEGGVNHLLVHWSPIIATGLPWVRIFGPVGLEYFQAALVAATIVPIWCLARLSFRPAQALAVTAVASLYPLLWANAVGDFHEMAFVPLLSATLVYALAAKRWALSYGAALFLCCTKEDQFVVLAANGLIFAFASRADRQARRAGLIIAGCAAAACLAYFALVRPMLDPHVPYRALSFFDWHALPNGVSYLNLLVTRLTYAAIVLAPLAFLPCLSRYGLFLIPGIVEIMAASQPVVAVPGAHYSALLTGYALAAFVDGAANVRRRGIGVAPVVAAAAAVSVGVQIFASPMEYWYYLYRRPSAHDALLESTLRSLPRNAAVGSEDEIFAHLGADSNASIDFANQPLFVYDRSHYSERWKRIDEPAANRAVASHVYRTVSDREGIVVLQRSGRPLSVGPESSPHS